MSAKTKKVDVEIRELFTQYKDQLTKRKKEVSDELVKWSEVLTQQIKDHVTKENKLLNEFFEERKSLIEAEQKRIIAAIGNHEKKKEVEEIKKLLDECRTFKNRLPIIQQYHENITFIHIFTTDTEVSAQNETEKNSTQKTNENSSNNQLIQDNNNGRRNITSARSRGLPNITSTESKLPNTSAIQTQTSIAHDSSLTDHAGTNRGGKNPDGILDKCPICFMIFPKSMNKAVREIHANEHYTD